MTRDNLRDAIDRMSEKAVDRFLQMEDILTEKPKKERAKRRKLIISTLAACLCLCFAIGGLFTPAGRSLWAMLTGKDPSTIMLDKNLANRPAGDHPIIALQSYESGRVHFLYNGKLLSKTVNANEGFMCGGVSDDENKIMYISNVYRDEKNVKHQEAYFVTQADVIEVEYKVLDSDVENVYIEDDGDIWLFSLRGIYCYPDGGRSGVIEYKSQVWNCKYRYKDCIFYGSGLHESSVFNLKTGTSIVLSNTYSSITQITESIYGSLDTTKDAAIGRIYFAETGEILEIDGGIYGTVTSQNGKVILINTVNNGNYKSYLLEGKNAIPFIDGARVLAVNNDGSLAYAISNDYEKGAYAIINGKKKIFTEEECTIACTDNLEELMICTHDGIYLSKNGGDAVKISDIAIKDLLFGRMNCITDATDTFVGCYFIHQEDKTLYYLNESYEFVKVGDNIDVVSNTHIEKDASVGRYNDMTQYYSTESCFVIDNDDGMIYRISRQNGGALEAYGKIEPRYERSWSILCSDGEGIYLTNDSVLYYVNKNGTKMLADNIEYADFGYDGIIYSVESEASTETSPLYKYYYSKNGSDGAFVVECETMYAENYENITYIFAYTGISDENNNRVYDVYGITAADKIECLIKGVYS